MKTISTIFLIFMLAVTSHAATANGKAKPKAKETATQTASNPEPPAQTVPQPPPINILSIIPAQGEPKTVVTLHGSGFNEKTLAYLANTEIQTNVISPQQLTFEIPRLAPGLYALFLKREDQTSRIYNFTLLPPKPVAESLSPDVINVCATGRDREVTISGRNFQEGSQVLFDGAIIRSRFESTESIAFSVPQVAGGLHQIQVRNPEETMTTAIALQINARPEIASISRGEAMVNYYNLVIEGRNFQQGASVMVDEKSFQVGIAAGAGKKLTSGVIAGDREKVMFVDCTKLIYQRSPIDFTDKDLRIQVVNPSGDASPVVQVTAP